MASRQQRGHTVGLPAALPLVVLAVVKGPGAGAVGRLTEQR
jgi:hypothetical protein